VFRPAAVICVLALAAAAVGAEELPLRDPLRPYTPGPANPAIGAAERGLELTAVVIGPQRKIAVINGELRREGERFDGITVVRIERGAVRLQRAGEEWIVHLNGRTQRDDSGDSTP
jgi:MSHA biogenesis protein MshK